MNPLPDLNQLADIVIRTAEDIIVARAHDVCCSLKADGSPVTEIDLAVQEKVRSELAQRWPAIGFLSEEMSPQQQQSVLDSGKAFWCLDPLDGTTNYIGGIPLFAISLALVSSRGCEIGLVYDPSGKDLFSARRGRGATLNGERLSLSGEFSDMKQCVAAVDFKRLPDHLSCALARHGPYRSQRNIGTVALEWCWMAAGRFQLYLHGGQKLWDYAAGELIFREAGGVAQTLEGDNIFARRLASRSAIAAVNHQLFPLWHDSIKELLDENRR